MKVRQEGWLPHLVDSIPLEARSYHTSMYSIALEGWRRGMKLKFYNLRQDHTFRVRYTLTYNGKTHYFNGSSGDRVTEQAFEICEDKGETNTYLSKAGVPIPKSAEFNENHSNEDVLQFAKNVKYPVVLKPTDGSSGKGVIAGIQTEKELKESLKMVRDDLGYKNVLLQEFVQGDEVRIYVLDGKVLAASNRRPANILGDGHSTIKHLIQEKNELRKSVPHLFYRPIKFDKEIKNAITEKGYTLDSIPKKNERIYLRKISNISRGGDPVDITDQLTKEQKEIAVQATKAIPGLAQCGVDMIINEKTGSGVILELNTRPGIGSHLFPIEGKAMDIPRAIIDYYFPETKQLHRPDANTYFEFGTIIHSLKEKSVIEIEVGPDPGKLVARKLLFTGSLELLTIYKKLRKYTDENNLHGYIQKNNENNIELVIAGVSEGKINDFSQLIKENLEKLQLKIIQEEEWNHPVKLGFELRDGMNSLNVKEIRTEVNEIKSRIKTLEKEKTRLKHRIKMIEKSRTWQMTAPIRKIIKKMNADKAR